MPVQPINLDGWQDYRGNDTAVLMFLETSHQAAFPVRDQLNENGKGNLWEPNYETATFGLVSCQDPRSLNAVINSRHSVILFGTRYDGLEKDFKGRYLITGYMKIDKVKDVRDRHLRNFMRDESQTPPECMALREAFALHACEMRLVGLADCFEITPEVMTSWGHKGRVSRQMKLVLEGEQLKQVMEHLQSRPDQTEEYIATVQEFIEFLEEGEGEAAAEG